MNNDLITYTVAVNLRHGGCVLDSVPEGSALEMAVEAGALEALPQATGGVFIGATAKGCRMVNEARKASAIHPRILRA